jgi:hypothetical protein
LPGRNANTNSNFDTGKSDANCYISSGKPDADGYGYSYSDDATSVAHAHGDRDGDNHAETYADAKAATNAVSSADAVSGWIKKLKELKSYRELAWQLASSFLFGVALRIMRMRFGVRRCSAAFKNVLLDNWRKVVVYRQRVGLKSVDRTHQRRSCYAFKPSRRTPAILVRYKHQPMLYRILMHIL